MKIQGFLENVAIGLRQKSDLVLGEKDHSLSTISEHSGILYK